MGPLRLDLMRRRYLLGHCEPQRVGVGKYPSPPGIFNSRFSLYLIVGGGGDLANLIFNYLFNQVIYTNNISSNRIASLLKMLGIAVAPCQSFWLADQIP